MGNAADFRRFSVILSGSGQFSGQPRRSQYCLMALG
jgi:hypothetical protein